MEKSGIYKINCIKCDQCYVGQTKRNLGIQIKEHNSYTKNFNYDKSALAKHVTENGHYFDIEDMELQKL